MELKDYNLTAFQQRWADRKAQESTFDHWVITVGMKKEDREQGQIVLPYYTKDGNFHAARLGKRRVLFEVVA